MTYTPNCPYCGAKTTLNTQFCQKCGARITTNAPRTESKLIESSPKSAKIALTLGILLGIFGGQRFYVGKKGTGLFLMLTLGFWTIIDLVLIIQNKFTDIKNRPLTFAHPLSGLKKIAVIVTAIFSWFIVTMGWLLLLIHFLTSGLVTTANQQLTAFRENDVAKAYSYTSIQYQKTITLNQFTNWLNEYPILKQNTNAFFIERGFSSHEGLLNYGFLNGIITAADGTEMNIKYFFIKEDGKWKILTITIGSTL